MLLTGQYDQFTTKLTNIGKWNIKTPTAVESLEIEFENMIYSLVVPIKTKI
jgi:hypothetical protein